MQTVFVETVGDDSHKTTLDFLRSGRVERFRQLLLQRKADETFPGSLAPIMWTGLDETPIRLLKVLRRQPDADAGAEDTEHLVGDAA